MSHGSTSGTTEGDGATPTHSDERPTPVGDEEGDGIGEAVTSGASGPSRPSSKPVTDVSAPLSSGCTTCTSPFWQPSDGVGEGVEDGCGEGESDAESEGPGIGI